MKKVVVKNPYDKMEISRIDIDDVRAVDQKLQTAYALANDHSKWLPVHRRIEILEKTATIMQEQVDFLTKLAAMEGGKPYRDSKAEVMRAINGVKLAIEHIGQMKGTQIPMGQTQASAGRLAFTMREPIGVVVSISAFNHPLNLIIHQTVPAIAVGAPVIIKPASSTPLSCINFVNILREAGLPEEWCQIVICERGVAEKLATDARVNYFSFIGSAKVGWYLRSKLSPGTRCALEHGGVAPVIVTEDANIDKMTAELVKGGFYHAGQVCVSVQKIFVAEKIIQQVTSNLKTAALKLKTGDQLDPETQVGPLITPEEVNRVDEWVQEAIESGAKLVCGGKKLSETCYEPTILLNPPEDCHVSKEEIFGPVICLYSYKNLEEAILKANSLPFAFQAAVYTRDLETALYASEQINASAVMINDHTAFRVDWMPFGGRDTSGIGVGGIPYSMHEMTREKLIVIKR